MLAMPVRLTQKDIRELQLAKAAIAAGMNLLLKQWGATSEDLEALYLAGAFGNYINRTSAWRIGLFNCSPHKIRSVGNTALLGAKLTLFTSDDEQTDALSFRSKMTHIPLASNPEFENAFIEALTFPDM